MSSRPTIRFGRLEDVPLILSFIKAAAAEQAPGSSVTATLATLSSTLHLDNTAPGDSNTDFQIPPGTNQTRFAWPLIVVAPDETVAGLAIYFYNYSTWSASPGVMLEELYVLPAYRRRGYGKLLIQAMAKEAERAGCAKMEWVCLKENQGPLRFYEELGAQQMQDWVILKVSREGIRDLAKGERE
ncbi:acyl-CoA N-acyltransferase [Lasiosphaeris hirsuta]|uniref:Acyl-CoA N-acyltransferase n=1 Tax=Lasiosphaeris hirsuta TaxID=260670 RepID=A0AA40A7C1_9PEZI|nr:acyl-CoA N-acyltransferase [Lasiosphaeris hirsuta]